MMDELDEDSRALALTDPSTADALRSRIAMMAPIEVAGGWAGGIQRRHGSFVEGCAKMEVVPENLRIRSVWRVPDVTARAPYNLCA